MSAHLDLQRPVTFGARLIEAKNENDYTFTTLDIDTPGLRVVVYVTTRAEADALVKAAVLAKDLLPPGPEPAHGENHVGNDGQVVSAIHPGECITCHGHATADGIFHKAVAQ
jgi:hypothetical protein